MSQTVPQSVVADLLAVVTLDNVPVTGLTFADLTCAYRKEGGVAFVNKALTALNFVEIGNGVYTVEFTAGELDTVGAFIFVLNGATSDQSVTLATVSSTASVVNSPVSVNTCVLNGHIYNLDGTAAEGVSVSAKLLGTPTVLSGVAITDEVVSVKTDATGEFFIELVRLSEVYITIPSLDYSRTITVPNAASANLFNDVA